MSTLQKNLAELRELDVSEVNLVSGGDDPDTQTCYTDSKGVKHCVEVRDDPY